MRATITADAGRGPGYAAIVIADAPEGAGPDFLLRRASDQKSLTNNGWQENETRLNPESVEREGATLRLWVGPQVVDALDDLDTYQLTLANAAPCVLQVGALVYSPIHGGHGLGDASLRPAPTPEPAPEPEPEAPPQEASAEPPADLMDEPPLSLEPEAPAPRRNLLLLPGLGLLLLAVLAALWWFVLRAPATPPEATSPPEAEKTATKAPTPTAPAPDTPTQNTPPQQSPLRMARDMLRGQAQPEQSLSAATPLRTATATPDQSDAAFLLLEDAAQKGNAAAMYLVAQFYDPQNTLPRGSIPVDLTQAKRWYDAALQKGNVQARQALDALRAYAQAQAAKGDAEAAALLQDWK